MYLFCQLLTQFYFPQNLQSIRNLLRSNSPDADFKNVLDLWRLEMRQRKCELHENPDDLYVNTQLEIA